MGVPCAGGITITGLLDGHIIQDQLCISICQAEGGPVGILLVKGQGMTVAVNGERSGLGSTEGLAGVVIHGGICQQFDHNIASANSCDSVSQGGIISITDTGNGIGILHSTFGNGSGGAANGSIISLADHQLADGTIGDSQLVGVIQICDLAAGNGHIAAVPNIVQLAAGNHSNTKGGLVIVIVVQSSLTADGAAQNGHFAIVANGNFSSGNGALTGDGQVAGSTHIDSCVITLVCGGNVLAVQIDSNLLLDGQHLGAQVHIAQQHDLVAILSSGNRLGQRLKLSFANGSNSFIRSQCGNREHHAHTQESQ